MSTKICLVVGTGELGVGDGCDGPDGPIYV